MGTKLAPSREKKKRKKKKKRREVTLVGWREWVSLPQLHVPAIKAKVDTGARSAALHAWNVRAYERDGRTWVSFDVAPFQRVSRMVHCTARLKGTRTVKNSGGQTETRYVIETDACLGEWRFPIEITLTNRDEMGFRMLLGRASVRKLFVVHPGRSFLFGDARAVARRSRQR